MATFLFDKIVFGPVKSRRLGESLGINLLPTDSKICNFDCVYCECGLTDATKGNLPTRIEVADKLEQFLKQSQAENRAIDAITFAGNGEPTLHPEFVEIIDDTYRIRNKYYPNAVIALLTNATTILSSKIQQSFKKIDQNMLKLDSVNKRTIELLNSPIGNYNLEALLNQMKLMHKPIIQTMFVKGTIKGEPLDNTSDEELVPWLEALEQIKPSLVMIYSIARDTPFDTLEKVPKKDLEIIGRRVRDLGFEVQISS